MKQKIDLASVINEIEPVILLELREDYNTLSFIRGFVNEALGFPDLIKDITPEQSQVEFQTTLDFICHLIKNRNCKVFSMEYDGVAYRGFFEWDLPLNEAMKKIKKIWLETGDKANPALQPWFTINDEKPSDKETKK